MTDNQDFQFVKLVGYPKGKPDNDYVELMEYFSPDELREINDCFQPKNYNRQFLQVKQWRSSAYRVISIIGSRIENKPDDPVIGINNYREIGFKMRDFLIKKDIDRPENIESDKSGGWKIILEQEDPCNTAADFGTNYLPIDLKSGNSGLKHNYQMWLTLYILTTDIADSGSFPYPECIEIDRIDDATEHPYVRCGQYSGTICTF